MGYAKHGKRFAAAALLAVVMMGAGNAPGTAESYTVVYEPETSLPLAATVCWRALAGLPDEEAPSSLWVKVDASLRVMTGGGEVLAESLAQWLEAVQPHAIPVLNPDDKAAEDKLHSFLTTDGAIDLFVVMDYRDAAGLNRFTSIPHVRGLVDYTGMDIAGKDALEDVIRVTNASGSKVCVLPTSAANRDNVRYLQSRLITVWAEAGDDRLSLISALATGVNGVVTGDYHAAYDAIGFFRDDAPTLLRVPFVIGHRGMPSEYVENALPGALAARRAGADIIENDIWLSRDGELFILHDQSLRRLFARADVGDTEEMTLAELQAVPFAFSAPDGVPYTNHTNAAKSRYGKIVQDDGIRIPTLRDYYMALPDAAHFVEIKSHDSEIVPAFKALTDEMGMAGQTAVITFNTDILDVMRRDWPGMSVGALGTEGAAAVEDRIGFADYGQIARRLGAETALMRLNEVLQPWNATYNPRFNFTYGLAQAGRHRGLTVWPWTYNDAGDFAQAWLRGVYGLTTNFAWWMSGNAARLAATDAALAAGDELPRPTLYSQDGTALDASGAEAVVLSGTAVSDGKAAAAGDAVVIWRIKCRLVLDGKEYGAYWLYSEPVRVRVEKLQ